MGADYAPVDGAGWPFPRQLAIHEYLPDDPAQPARHVEFRVLAIEVNTAIDPSVFTIDRSTAEYVWDVDASRYLKRPGG